MATGASATSLETAVLHVGGLHYASEKSVVERVLSNRTGVARVEANPVSTVPASGHLDRFRLVPTRANGQPAFGCYMRDPHVPVAHAYGLMVLTMSGSRVAAITGFPDTGVFPHFGLPRTLRD